MDKVKLLSQSVASQIAAGEVVSRPASVVKELVENSVDAGATSICIVLTDAGRTMIQVTDNGCGMSQADALMSFERHATSKIHETDDLYRLTTFGFRGEAVPSIAAVSEVTLRTRTADSDTGVQITANGDGIQQQEPCVCNVGTTFTVRNLFYNVPARRKFLKSNQTELTHIMTEVERAALSHPEIAFELTHQGQQLLSLPASAIKQRIVNIFGKKMNQALLPVDVRTTLVGISGFASNLESTRGRGSQQFFFVNGRFMKHPYFHKAVVSAYENLVQEGDQPSYFLFLDVAPDTIDVNIHPTKTEVKFQDEQVIWKILSAAVKESVGMFEQMPTIDFNVADMPEIPVYDDKRPVTQPKVDYNPNFNPFASAASQAHTSQQSFQPKRNTDDWTVLYGEAQKHGVNDAMPQYGQTDIEPELGKDAIQPLGQFDGRYILLPVEGGLKMVDQHRAHLRVLYERYLTQAENHAAASQGLLFPEMFQLSPADATAFEALKPRFSALGFDISDMGRGAIAVQGIPSGLESQDYENIILGMISDWKENPVTDEEGQIQAMALSMARKSAIPYGRQLSMQEMQELLRSLDACKLPTRTPDGHDTYTILTLADIAKRFA